MRGLELGKRKIRVESISISARVPRTVLEEIERIIKEGYYMDVNDYLREVIRRDLEARRRLKERTSDG